MTTRTYIVEVEDTEEDGQVVRWYPSVRHRNHHMENVTATRDGVTVHHSGMLAERDDVDAFIRLVERAHLVVKTIRRGIDARTVHPQPTTPEAQGR